MLFPKGSKLNPRQMRYVKKLALKCKQWKIYQDQLLKTHEFWYFKWKRTQAGNRTTENMLRVARQQLEQHKLNTRRLGYCSKMIAQRDEQIK